MEARRVLLSGYSGAEDDMILAEVTAQGRLRRLGGARHGENPSFCCRMDGRIYAVAELPQGASVAAYALEGDDLRPLQRLELPGKRGLCHLAAVDGALYGSCYESGHFFALDGALSRICWEFQPPGTPRAHWALAMDGRLYLADLGNDRVYRFALQDGLPDGAPEAFRLPPGSGPRQPLPLPGGFGVVCELDGMLRLFHGDGSCRDALPASRAPGPNAPGGACRAGRTLFVGNRGPNTVSAFQLDAGGAAYAGEWPAGSWPRHLACLGERWVLAACSRDDAVWLYRWDGQRLAAQDRLLLHQASCVLPL